MIIESKPKSKILIGIDPDTEKSGVALFHRGTKDIKLYNLKFFELYDFLIATKLQEVNIECVIDAGWLNNSNWHGISKNMSYSQKGEGESKVSKVGRYMAEVGSRTGACHETGRKIVEMCEHLGISHREVRPRTSKVKSDQFKLLTGYTKRTNQEQRDAAMLVFGY